MIQIFCDGGIRGGNPGGIPSWAWVRREGKTLLKSGSGLVPQGRPATNNIAEYYAVLHALHALIDDGLTDAEVEILGDSQLIICQMDGSYAVNQPDLKKLHDHAQTLLVWFDKPVRFTWIPREQNVDADALAGDASYNRRRRPPSTEDIVP